MPHAILIKKHGNPEVMCWKELPDAYPSGGAVQLSQTAVGLNYIDVYQRSGRYK